MGKECPRNQVHNGGRARDEINICIEGKALQVFWAEVRRSSLPLSWPTPRPGSVRGGESGGRVCPVRCVRMLGLCCWFKVVGVGWGGVCRSHHLKKHDVSPKKKSPFINSHKDHLWIL